MKFVIWIVGLFALAVLVGLASTVNTGYAILFLPPYRMEVSFNALIIGILLLIVVVHFVLRLIGIAARMPEEVRRFQRQKKLKAARHALREAGIAFFEGRFQRAEREAIRAIDNEESEDNRALALLIAARAAGSMRDYDKRNQYLAKLDALPSRLQLAHHVLEAELKLDAKDAPGALAAVERARTISPNLTSALKIELRIRLLQKQPDAVLALTEKLLKSDAIDAEQARRYRLTAYRQQLAALTSGAEIQAWIKRIPDVERANPDLLADVVARLTELEDSDQAATLIAQALGDEELATPELAQKLGRLAASLSPDKRLALMHEAEGWLTSRPDDHLLLLALGRLALAQQLWGKAQSYLEASLSLTPTLTAHAELARLFEATGKEGEAHRHETQCLRMALEMGY
ncbi:heme biosynthesis HemY N-terminal domain-containing protein [Crenobacter sp. SG2305]|uniref:heme biosynthesis HemY N-terminal domain-containing protein n=1 Tax=Crenobacter oryzisoli TaxID=3056844 RepID=UPI0025AAECDA|nr:heme biosynthesis HemY N-terminal domain-containing protein [Crenobacter sp. SG2305]MDN0081255.1 heme biosynthesis HemY N-terminal domain-containing protein [Crenobacter sp. SG2305]